MKICCRYCNIGIFNPQNIEQKAFYFNFFDKYLKITNFEKKIIWDVHIFGKIITFFADYTDWIGYTISKFYYSNQILQVHIFSKCLINMIIL